MNKTQVLHIIFLPVHILIEIFSLRPIKGWVRVWVDRYLLLSFVLFAITSFYIEPYLILRVDLSRYEHDHYWDIGGQFWWWYAKNFDPLFLDVPTWMWLMSVIDCFVIGSLHVILAYGFFLRREWVSGPSLICSGLLLYQIPLMYFPYEFIEEMHRINVVAVVLVNVPYAVMPLVLAWRVWPRGNLLLFPKESSKGVKSN